MLLISVLLRCSESTAACCDELSFCNGVRTHWGPDELPTTPFWRCCANGTAGHLSEAAEATQPDGYPFTPPPGTHSPLPASTPNLLLTLRQISADCSTAVPVSRSCRDLDPLHSPPYTLAHPELAPLQLARVDHGTAPLILARAQPTAARHPGALVGLPVRAPPRPPSLHCRRRSRVGGGPPRPTAAHVRRHQLLRCCG